MNGSRFFRKRTTWCKAVSCLAVCLVGGIPMLSSPGCGANSFLGLEDYQRDVLFGIGAVAIALLADQAHVDSNYHAGADPNAGQTEPVQSGLACWDSNGNGTADPEEDVNADGFFDASDCQGADGAPGASTSDSTATQEGANGLSCWDVNGNGIGEEGEDLDGDGHYTALDCRGADGADGVGGTDGIDGVDGADGTDGVDGIDGVDGADGTDGVDGIDGVDGANGTDGVDGIDGIDGLSCWDLNGNGIAEPEEDIDHDGFYTALDCRGADGADGVGGTDGIDGIDGAEGTDGVDGINGIDGLNCWDLNGDGVADPNEDLNGDGVYDAQDCRGEDATAGELLSFFDIFVDDFFTAGGGTYGSISGGGVLDPSPIEEPALGLTEVVAYRIIVPYLYDESGHDDPAVDQNEVIMRLTFWREGPVEDCFIFRFDAFRARHGSGISLYGSERYIKLDDPTYSDPWGTLVVVDLPLNNADGSPAAGLGLPTDLRTGEFLAFELNILPRSLNDPNVSYVLLGAEFVEAFPGTGMVRHATVFHSSGDVDCPFIEECSNDHECDDGQFCNGQETCSDGGQCAPAAPACEVGEMCDEVDGDCVSCDTEIPEGKTVICHVPGSALDRSHTLIVASPAVPVHLAHGDTLGACEEDCDDGGDEDDEGGD